MNDADGKNTTPAQYIAVTGLVMNGRNIAPGHDVPNLPGRDYRGMLERGEIMINPVLRAQAGAQAAAQQAPTGYAPGTRVLLFVPGNEQGEGLRFLPAVVQGREGDTYTVQAAHEDEAGRETLGAPEVVRPPALLLPASAQGLHDHVVLLTESYAQADAEAQRARQEAEAARAAAPQQASGTDDEPGDDEELAQVWDMLEHLRAVHLTLLNAVGRPLKHEGQALPARVVDVLHENGYETEDAVRFATDDELLAVNGIAEKTLKTVREHYPADPVLPPDDLGGGGEDDEGEATPTVNLGGDGA